MIENRAVGTNGDGDIHREQGKKAKKNPFLFIFILFYFYLILFLFYLFFGKINKNI